MTALSPEEHRRVEDEFWAEANRLHSYDNAPEVEREIQDKLRFLATPEDPIMQIYTVSDDLAGQLEEHGEHVARIAALDSYVWGRTTAGQSVAEDYVIREIYNATE